MKLTREQISNLSDTELNQAMIWLYGYPDYGSPENLVGVISWGGSYLEDWAATMPLAVAKRVSVINISDTTQWFACNNVSFETICMSPDGNDDGVSCMDCSNQRYSTKPLRAICEVLVMIAMERKK